MNCERRGSVSCGAAQSPDPLGGGSAAPPGGHCRHTVRESSAGNPWSSQCADPQRAARYGPFDGRGGRCCASPFARRARSASPRSRARRSFPRKALKVNRDGTADRKPHDAAGQGAMTQASARFGVWGEKNGRPAPTASSARPRRGPHCSGQVGRCAKSRRLRSRPWCEPAINRGAAPLQRRPVRERCGQPA